MTTYNSWSNCEECGFHGLMDFHSREDENYEDKDALGVMMDCICPSCGTREYVLVVMEQYEEMRFMARNVESSKTSKK